MTSRVLRDKYKDKTACQLAAGSGAAALVSDAVDSNGTQSFFDTISKVALMRCYGISYGNIILYYLFLVVLVLLCGSSIGRMIPDSMWKKCRVCTRQQVVVDDEGNQSETCAEYRQGTPEECRRAGRMMERIIGFVVGLVVAGIVHRIFIFRLKLTIYKSEAVVGEMILRTVA